MKKGTSEINLFEVSHTKKKESYRHNTAKTTDINILLNRVRHSKKKEFIKKITYLSLFLTIIFSVFFF